MKKALLIILLFGYISLTYGQQIEFGGIFACSTSKKYADCFGYRVGYNQTVKSNNRLGFAFSEYFYTTAYDDIYPPEFEPSSLLIKQVDPNNKRYSLTVSYAFDLINNPKSKLYFGPEMGLNYFVIKEQYERIPNGDIDGGNFNSNNTFSNRIGIGFLMEFQLEEVMAKKISTYISINPEFTSFEKIGMMGSPYPYFIGWLNLNLGIRYTLNKAKQP
jgi:hypothetical protein